MPETIVNGGVDTIASQLLEPAQYIANDQYVQNLITGKEGGEFGPDVQVCDHDNWSLFSAPRTLTTNHLK